MSAWIAIPGGFLLCLAGWSAARRVARAPVRLDWFLALDLIAPVGLGAVLFAASARPIFAGATSLAVFLGFAFADRVKRAVLREPAVFSDMSELIELFRHPGLYLPFAGTGMVIGGALALVAALSAILLTEPLQFPWSPLPGGIAIAAVAMIAAVASRPPALAFLAGLACRARPSTDPAADAARLGPLAMLPIHGVIARAERPARRAALEAPVPIAPPADAAPILMVQCESFFDARRLHGAIPRDLLPEFDRLACDGIQAGRLAVPGWGAYTVRAEFAALTGIAPDALGFDRWNPYHAFARVPLPSLAWRLKAEGYRTLCLHPFDRRYYGRHKIMPNLGFDAFLGEEVFTGAACADGFVTDEEVARRAIAILADNPRGLFLFVITMANHGPWSKPALDPAPDLPEFPGRDQWVGYLHGLRRTDAMLGQLRDALDDRSCGILAAYGDHRPSLPALDDGSDTDYVIWDARGGAGMRRDLAAHELGNAILAAACHRRLASSRRFG